MALCRVCYEKEATTFNGLCQDCFESLFTKDKDLSDEECDKLAQESHDNLVHSLVEAGGEIRELRRLLTLAKDDLLYLLLDGKGYRQELNDKGLVALSVLMNEYGMSKDKVDKDFKEISEYLEGLENE